MRSGTEFRAGLRRSHLTRMPVVSQPTLFLEEHTGESAILFSSMLWAWLACESEHNGTGRPENSTRKSWSSPRLQFFVPANVLKIDHVLCDHHERVIRRKLVSCCLMGARYRRGKTRRQGCWRREPSLFKRNAICSRAAEQTHRASILETAESTAGPNKSFAQSSNPRSVGLQRGAHYGRNTTLDVCEILPISRNLKRTNAKHDPHS
jgi:hypothetical protein